MRHVHHNTRDAVVLASVSSHAHALNAHNGSLERLFVVAARPLTKLQVVIGLSVVCFAWLMLAM